MTVLDRGPVPQREVDFPENSLAHLDTCTLLAPAVLGVLPGIDAHEPRRDFANWGCGWENATGAGVTPDFSRDNDLTDDGQPTRLGGRKSYVEPRGEGDDTCVVRAEHRNHTDTADDAAVELVMLTAHGPQPHDKLCATGKALATAVAKRLPKP